MEMRISLIYPRIKYVADYEELYCWVSFSTSECFKFTLSFFHIHDDEKYIGPC